MAVAALVLSIIGLVMAFIPCTWWLGIILGALATIFGFIAKGKAAKEGKPQGMALAGMIMGIIAIAISILWFILVISAMSAASGAMEQFGREMEEAMRNLPQQ